MESAITTATTISTNIITDIKEQKNQRKKLLETTQLSYDEQHTNSSKNARNKHYHTVLYQDIKKDIRSIYNCFSDKSSYQTGFHSNSQVAHFDYLLFYTSGALIKTKSFSKSLYKKLEYLHDSSKISFMNAYPECTINDFLGNLKIFLTTENKLAYQERKQLSD